MEKDLQISVELKKELDTRLDSYKKNRENVLDWEELKKMSGKNPEIVRLRIKE